MFYCPINKQKSLIALTLFISLITLTTGKSHADSSLEKVRMQLRWHHQFQFAGYYAAKHKGYYQDAGFDVDIIAGTPQRQPVTEILNANADFAEGNSEVLLARIQGKPLVALAAIYQRSPSILITRNDSGISRLNDLKGKSIMLVDGINSHDVDLLAMLSSNNNKLSEYNIIPSSYNINDLYEKKVDAFNAYLSNEPFFLQEKRIGYNTIRPSDYGIDFYSDILFTTEKRAKKDPQGTARFTQATIKGWQYALDHPEEIIQIIKKIYLSKNSLNHLRYEANTVRELIIPELISIGHMHPDRFRHMANTFLDLGMTLETKHLSGFIFAPTTWQDRILKWLPYILLITIILFIVLFVLFYTNRRLEAEILRRQYAEEELKKLALTDHLTQLTNPRGFQQILSSEVQRSLRSGNTFCLAVIDIDFFKRVNDNYGHHTGDEVLQYFANILRSTLRQTDTCARTGGEEFVILLPMTPLKSALELAERTRQTIEDSTFSNKDLTIKITASMGLSEWQAHEDGHKTLERADQALYQAKEEGRNCIRYQP